jgi:hypothetical protein
MEDFHCNEKKCEGNLPGPCQWNINLRKQMDVSMDRALNHGGYLKMVLKKGGGPVWTGYCEVQTGPWQGG